MSSLSLRSILADGKLVGDNFHDWYRTLRIVLMHEKLIDVIDKPHVPEPSNNDDAETISAYKKSMLNVNAQVGPHVMKMISLMEQLEKLGFKLGKELSQDLILQTLPESRNQGSVLVVGKSNKKKGKWNSKSKKKPFVPKGGVTKPKDKKGSVDQSNVECFFCNEKGHWKRNCRKYLHSLKEKKQANEDYHIDDDPKCYEEAMRSLDHEKWQEAMESEMESMKINKVWTLVDASKDIKPIGCKWVYKKKNGADGKVETYKARLVANGYRQKEGKDYDETYSPMAKLKSIRILLDIAAYHDYEIWQMDVKTAFLNGELKEDVYMTQPEGFTPMSDHNKVCKLQ
ncbi:PREDICTED: uncharacterized protein LOC109329337 [Lupinus angustifolius]|uniref:uncharacterized protein LOC109329337 n=1 Tax=Lupinus angustifolius TaxID=3871 RepID=UPI00092F2BFF|nr:PREDICTED: uncharacterized protein LOC109329337 [Lupinus angustifolius]